MTGFGRGTARGDGYAVTVEVQSVNRRNLETIFSLPKEWASLEPALNEVVREAAQRGRVHTTVSVQTGEDSAPLQWDDAEVSAVLSRLGKLAARVGSPWPPDVDALLRVVLALQGGSRLADPEEAQPVVLSAAREALGAFVSMRATEGEALAVDLRQRMAELQSLLGHIRESSAGRVETYRELLFARLRQAGLELELDDERVLKEVAIFADRCDVTEEMTRLESHLSQFVETMAGGGEQAVGRKLEFILQEVLREFNTIGSKSNKLEVTKHVIEAKNEIERIREQIQNTE
ncbi:MAG: YicC/YloC family endoribonuclease [Verrucomicrobiota bacterium]